MQELNYSRGGAALVISVDKLFSNRKCSLDEIKRRRKTTDIYSGLGLRDPIMDPNEEECEDHEVGSCICVLDWTECSAPNSQRNTTHTSDWLASSRFCFLQLFCPISELNGQLRFLDPVIKGLPSQANQEGTTFHMADIFYWIKNFLNEATQQHAIVMDSFNRLIILSDNYITTNKLCHVYGSRNLRTFIRHRGSSGRNSKMSAVKHDNAQRSFCLKTSGEDEDRDSLRTWNPEIRQKTRQNDNHSQRPWRRSKSEKMKIKKSVSFEEDVIVYLFDQETPTLKLPSEPSTSPPFHFPSIQSDVMSEDNGLQWEDDFSALECAQPSGIVSLPTKSWTSQTRPELCSLAQTCLFLTYVTESDLEL
ncbi:class A basic helix-loop-helix protein 15 isoform X1 [Xiphophorus maculatus]|uniref:class A basic helix-loop-helix protein 15 isoform X1 n=1 Tax=Xiphophorus maculatus TaxID=8083 RepID=UPI000C6EC80B|nr:class A basic helix-loop-helix protein 15 isoform X1 [Xiphophorus maculatus]XP_023196429.1 class A basic helix-loop-helix protein 15 isoform X1 [Xiphophorus maculatus]XP_023196430.1 class A basic helix-loop-helix protein 15 isoform X1 [Xiphophorus maculatus]XP_023196431.1 class A basic helix-loop-helix protein 15 isoform X1 [Xiphophorus maculatus]XP_023196432.1 class A basic helix-loop-helix protein 15 isoform X1 [Xiphophorus maculatus]